MVAALAATETDDFSLRLGDNPPMLNYDFPLYRPPSEGNNVIIQATLGCSYNRCTFCSMYRSKAFRARPQDQVFADIDRAASLAPTARRVFLADGDALVLPTAELLEILGHLRARFPGLARVSCYALPANLLKKSVEELTALREAGLTLIYYGIESGNADLLRRIRKGATVRGMKEGLLRASAAGMKVSGTLILGLGGRHHWQAHIDDSAALVNELELNYLSTLQLGLDPVVEQSFYEAFGDDFVWQDDDGMLREQQRLIAALEPARPLIFRSNHASNALPLKGNLPADRDRLLAELAGGVEDASRRVPQWLRGY